MSAAVQQLMSYGAAAAPSGLLDAYTANLAFCLSRRKRITAYAGNCDTIRSAGGGTQAIGFSGTARDVAAQNTFLGSNSGFLVTWNDQSGNGQHFGHSTSGNQPRIANAGVDDGKLVFDGSDDCIVSTNTSGSPAAFTIYMRGGLRAFASLYMIFETSNDFGANTNATGFYADSSNSKYVAYLNRASGFDEHREYLFSNPANVFDSNKTIALVFDPPSGAGSNTDLVYYVAGAMASGSAPNTSNDTSALGDYLYNIGARAGGAAFGAPLDLTDCIGFNAGHDATTVAAISAILDVQ